MTAPPRPIALAACLLGLAAFPTAEAIPPAAALEELRDSYHEAKDLRDATPRPALGEPDFRAKLRNWSEISQRHRDAAIQLFAALVPLAAEGPDEEFPKLREELRLLHRDLVDGPTQASHDSLSLIAERILPLVRDREPAPARATLLAALTTPDDRIRDYDRRTRQELPSEPTGLFIQEVHALALARAGEFDRARTESDLLLQKAGLLLRGRLPDLEVHHGGGKRTKTSLHREFLLHRALIEDLAGDAGAAAKFAAQAGAIGEPDPAIRARQEGLLRRLSP